jgi:alpha-galactosidase
VDYIKCDGCQGASRPTINASWILFREGIDLCANTTGRQVVLSVESCGPNNADDCQAWIPSLANLWRTTGDIQATWASVLSNLDQNNELAAIAGPGHWSESNGVGEDSSGGGQPQLRRGCPGTHSFSPPLPPSIPIPLPILLSADDADMLEVSSKWDVFAPL